MPVKYEFEADARIKFKFRNLKVCFSIKNKYLLLYLIINSIEYFSMFSLNPEILTSKGWAANFNYEVGLNYYFLTG
jgi:ABC-type phosphate transport system permease subunit